MEALQPQRLGLDASELTGGRVVSQRTLVDDQVPDARPGDGGRASGQAHD